MDGNGKITAADARKILRAAVGLESFSPEDTCQHEWGEWTKVNRTNAGYHVRTCALCGKEEKENCSYGADRFPAEGSTLTAATCTKDATFYQVCSVCAGKKFVTESALHHSGKVLVPEKSKTAGVNADGTPNCLAEGWEYYECPLCGANGDTTSELKVAVPAPGHTAPNNALTVDKDVICTRCNKVMRPCFNSMVNTIEEGKYLFSEITKSENSGEVTDSNIVIPQAAKTLFKLMANTSDGEDFDFTEEGIVNMLKDGLADGATEYSNYMLKSPYIFNYYPLPFSNTVSELTASDVKSIKEEQVGSIDFLAEIPETVHIQQNNYNIDQDMREFLALGAVTGKISKVTVELKDEAYSAIKDSADETALMRATGVDIRSYVDAFSQTEDAQGMMLKMDCKDVTTQCTVTYYFLQTEEGGETNYTPIASKYVTNYVVKQHVDLKAGTPIDELGVDSILLNTFLRMTGLKKGDELVLLEGTVDININDSTTDYYLLSAAE